MHCLITDHFHKQLKREPISYYFSYLGYLRMMADDIVKTEVVTDGIEETEDIEASNINIEANKTQLYFKGVSKQTTEDDLIAHFQPYGATLQLYKSAKMGFDSPYGFLLCENGKVEALLAQTHQINGVVLEINYARRKVYTMKYFLDTRITKGAIGEIPEDKLKEYFSKFGEVTRINIDATKGIGFLDLNVPEKEGKKSITGLAWKKHTVEGHVIDVQESSSKRKRKGRGGKRFSKRIKPS